VAASLGQFAAAAIGSPPDAPDDAPVNPTPKAL
jgi:hypothetical protein